MLRLFLLLVSLVLAQAAIEAHKVTTMPSFPDSWPFTSYSGMLNVTANPPVNGYDGWVIHYQLDLSQSDPSSDPVVAWHTGGPGGSSIYGLYAEMGYFLLSNSGFQVNNYSWNRISNMLYLEAPAGSFLAPQSPDTGFSYCTIGGVRQATCAWDDVTQAEAYAHTLLAFYEAYPELKSNHLHLAGESYAGQYIPNIATHILKNVPPLADKLKGILVGNGCWGGGEHTPANAVMCNGPNEKRDKTQLYYGKGLLSKKLYDQLQDTCTFPDLPITHTQPAQLSTECNALLKHAWDNEDADIPFENTVVGRHDVYDLYDNCAGAASQLSVHRRSSDTGGYVWTCGQFDKIPSYFERSDVKTALHLPQKSMSSAFAYNTSGPASVTLYPFLISKIRVVIYNGDADSSVPAIGNEAWTSGMETLGVVRETEPWHAWYLPEWTIPAGYATNYQSVQSPDQSFTFVTLKLSGHEVPQFSPLQGWALFSRYLSNKKF